MDDFHRFQLLYGPYKMPRCKVGGRLKCRIRGKVKVSGISDAPIQWPQTWRKSGGPPFLILCGGLVRAIQRESALAVCHWWGITAQTVSTWRKALGVLQSNEGTRKLHGRWFPELRDDEALERQRRSLKSPARAAKIAAKLRGRKRSPEVMEPAHAANRGRQLSQETRTKMSQAAKKRGTYPPAAGRPFTPEEDALLGIMLDREVAEKIGRDYKTVARRWKKLGIPSYRERPGYSDRRLETSP